MSQQGLGQAAAAETAEIRGRRAVRLGVETVDEAEFFRRVGRA